MVLPYLEDGSASRDDVKSDEDSRINVDKHDMFMAFNLSRSQNLEAADAHAESEETEDFDPQLFLRNQPELSDVVFSYFPDMQPNDSLKRKAKLWSIRLWKPAEIQTFPSECLSICKRTMFTSNKGHTFIDGIYSKDLTVLGLDLAKVAIIDNCPHVYRLQINNGIPIKSWYDDPTDDSLITLLPFLESLADANDVRPVIAKRFGNKE
ncbi:unnamed protein product [Arabidopsis arenosa]|uniref:Mitochondrial import inner membrane translocase subunit TIM50 n=1 Tax=Arabidopsis arenosa TaxID=38785 RepID=A0A8S2ARK0_ARAAE|nr:unnamed protein product [Arabidopsis arenosa]